MAAELAIFAAFAALASLHHAFAERHELHKAHGWHKLAAIWAVALSPAFWHAVQEYMVHFVVYSGHVLPQH